jgi:FkbM family methyltransferase
MKSFTNFYRLLGTPGLYLALCRSMRWVPFSVTLPAFGTVGTLPEVLNIYDNFAAGELRDIETEALLQGSKAPVIVDCGVNVGVTVRWWLHLNKAATIFGIDMMEESHNFTFRRMGASQSSYRAIVCALTDQDGQSATIRFQDPLLGTNRLDESTTPISSSPNQTSSTRLVLTSTLDKALSDQEIDQIDLLKIDIEGHGGKALCGARKTLTITKNVILEVHDREELTQAHDVLCGIGFRLRSFKSRNLWFTRS